MSLYFVKRKKKARVHIVFLKVVAFYVTLFEKIWRTACITTMSMMIGLHHLSATAKVEEDPTRDGMIGPAETAIVGVRRSDLDLGLGLDLMTLMEMYP